MELNMMNRIPEESPTVKPILFKLSTCTLTGLQLSIRIQSTPKLYSWTLTC